MRSRARTRLVTVGNKGGKTFIAAYEAACYALGEHPYKRVRVPNVGVIVTALAFDEGMEKVIIPTLEKVVGSRDIVRIKKSTQGRAQKIEWRGGSVTHLMSAEQKDKEFEGSVLDWAWIDEPLRRNIFVALKRGMLTTGGHIWMTCTPLDEPWIYEDLYMKGVSGKHSEIEVFEGSSDENIYISETEKKEFLSHLTEDEVETRWYGKFKHLAGRVFKEYKPERHRIPPFDIPPHWPVWVAIDPHRNKPHAVLFMTVAPSGHKYVCNEICLKCSIYELADHILEISEQYNIVNMLIDTSAQEDGWVRMSARQMLEEKGVRTKLAQKRNLKASGITLINQLFHDDELFIFEGCVRTQRELTLQVYRTNKMDTQKILEEPEKKFDDMCDCLRYVLVENPEFSGIAEIKEGPEMGRFA